MSRVREICPILCLLIVGTAHAEVGTGYVGSQEDPRTHDIPPVTKDWQDGVVLDPKTGDYTVTYKENGAFHEVIFYPRTKVDPILKSTFRYAHGEVSIAYRYSLKSGTKSRQNIEAMRTEITSVNGGSLASPSNWRGSAVNNYQSTGLPIRLNWTYWSRNRLDGLPPGKKINGFSLESSDLPGVAMMRIEGGAERTTWLGGPPDIDTPVGTQFNQIKFHDYVPSIAVIPRIRVGNPFESGATLDALRAHIIGDIVGMKAIDATFASQLDRLIQAAANAVHLNNSKAAGDNIKDARQLLKKEYADVDKEDDDDFDKDDDKSSKGKSGLIDKLAARVIDFDLKYVEKRLKQD